MPRPQGAMLHQCLICAEPLVQKAVHRDCHCSHKVVITLFSMFTGLGFLVLMNWMDGQRVVPQMPAINMAGGETDPTESSIEGVRSMPIGTILKYSGGGNKVHKTAFKYKRRIKRDPMENKIFFDVKVPNWFERQDIATTLINKKQGGPGLVGRFIMPCLADLMGDPAVEHSSDERYAHKEVQFRIEDVKGRTALTDFHRLRLTRDKVGSAIRKKCSLIRIKRVATTSDGYKLFLFMNMWTRKVPGQQKRFSRAQTKQVQKMRKIAWQIMDAEIPTMLLKELILGSSLERKVVAEVERIYPVRDCQIWKFRQMEKPAFDISALYGDRYAEYVNSGDSPDAVMAEPEQVEKKLEEASEKHAAEQAGNA